MIKLSDFARQQGVTSRAVQQMVKKYESELAGHFERKGQDGTWLDDAAQELLRSKMLKKPIIVYDETASPLLEELQTVKDENKQLREKLTDILEKLNQAKDYQLSLQAELMEQKLIAAKINEAEEARQRADEAREQAERQAIEARKREIETEIALTKTTEENKTLTDIAEINAQEAEAARQRAEAAEAEIKRLQNRSFWQRIRNK